MKNPAMSRPLYEVDPQIAAAIDNEVRRQHDGSPDDATSSRSVLPHR